MESLFNRANLRLPVQSHTTDTISAELSALTTLAERIINGDQLKIEEQTEYTERGTKITAFVISQGMNDYLFTIEEKKGSMILGVHSMQIADLMISLPSPMFISIQDGEQIGDSLEV